MADINEFLKRLGIAGKPQYENSPMDDLATDDAPMFKTPVEEDEPSLEDSDMAPVPKAPIKLASQADIDKMATFPRSPAEEALAKKKALANPTEQRLDEEFDLSSELQAEDDGPSLDLTPQQEIASVQAPSPMSRYQELLSKYNDQNRNLALLQGANQIAQGLAMGAGGKIGDNSEAVRMLQGMNQDPLKQIQSEDMAAMSDPNSDISKYARQQAMSLVKDESLRQQLSTMSASQLKGLGFKGIGEGRDRYTSLMGTLSKDGLPLTRNERTGQIFIAGTDIPYDVREGVRSQYGKMAKGPQGEDVIIDPINRSSTAVFAKDGSIAPAQKDSTTQESKTPEVDDISYLDNLKANRPNAAKLVEEKFKELNDSPDFKNLKESVDNIDVAKEMVRQNKPGSGPMLSRALLSIYESGGKFTDQDVEQMKGPTDLKAKLHRFLVTNFDSTQAVSGIDQNAQMELLNLLEKKKTEQFAKKFYPVVNQLSKQGVDKDFAARYLTGDRVSGFNDIIPPKNIGKSGSDTKTSELTSNNKSGEVRRKTADGKIAIFDDKTKKFLRYEE